jgi:hypothetical protein
MTISGSAALKKKQRPGDFAAAPSKDRDPDSRQAGNTL